MTVEEIRLWKVVNNSLSMSDANDKLKEKPIKVVNEMQCGDRRKQILEKLTLVAQSSVNSVAELFIKVTQFVSRTAYRKSAYVMGTLYTYFALSFIALHVQGLSFGVLNMYLWQWVS